VHIRRSTLIYLVPLLLLIVLFFGHKINFTSDDLGRHLANGRLVLMHPELLSTNFFSYTATEFPFTNHHWFSGVVLYVIYAVTGFVGLSIFKIVLFTLIFWLLWNTARLLSDEKIASIVALFSLMLLTSRSELRPELFSYLFFALSAYICVTYMHTKNYRILAWLIPLQILWVNMHIYFFVGILSVGLFAFDAWIRSGSLFPRGRVRLLLLLTCALAAVSLINPHGIYGVLYPFHIFNNYGYAVVENQSYFFMRTRMQDPHFVLLWAMSIALVVSWVVNIKRINVWLGGMSVFFIVFSFMALRNFGFLAVVGLPALSAGLQSITRYTWFRYGAPSLYVLGVIMIGSLPLVYPETTRAVVNDHSWGFGLEKGSLESAQFFSASHIEGPVFNNYDIGSAMIFSLYPQYKVFIDNRPEAYPSSFITSTYTAMQENNDTWKNYVKQYDIKSIYFGYNDITPWAISFMVSRMHDPEWPVVYADQYAVIMVRRDQPLSTLSINRTLVSYIQNRLQNNDLTLPMRISLVNLLELSGMHGDASHVWKNLSERYPSSNRVRIGRAFNLVNGTSKEEVEQGITYMHEAIDNGMDLPGIRNQLGIALARLGKIQEARQVWYNVLDEYPHDEAALHYLQQTQGISTFPTVPVQSR